MNNEQKKQVVLFKLDTMIFGIKTEYIKEIIRMVEINRIPNSPDFLEGIINFQGEIINVINLKKIMGLESIKITIHSPIIIAVIEQNIVGIVIDNVDNIISYGSEQIKPISGTIPFKNILEGIIKKDDGLILILNLAELLNYEKRILSNKTIENNMHVERAKIGKDNNEQNILHQRAISLSIRRIEENIKIKKRLLLFPLSNEWYAIDIEYVQEIFKSLEIFYLPYSPFFVDGVLNYRGTILPAINLKKILGLQEDKSIPQKIVIVVELGIDTKVGLIADNITEVIDVDISEMQLPLSTMEQNKANFFEGDEKRI
ncbi:chemotaxis protein CheW [Candidatus Desantisbacteria bacterium]|nr:chemotaxis protein CheW [Candidatus Desantisbacteria bacterium]